MIICLMRLFFFNYCWMVVEYWLHINGHGATQQRNGTRKSSTNNDSHFLTTLLWDCGFQELKHQFKLLPLCVQISGCMFRSLQGVLSVSGSRSAFKAQVPITITSWLQPGVNCADMFLPKAEPHLTLVMGDSDLRALFLPTVWLQEVKSV